MQKNARFKGQSHTPSLYPSLDLKGVFLAILLLLLCTHSYAQIFYGITYSGGSANVGAIIKFDAATGSLTAPYSMTSANGEYPSGSLTLYNGKYYGGTFEGGANSVGVIFEWDPINNVYTKKKDLIALDGASFAGSLTLYNGKFYGVTYSGGIQSYGVIFEWDPVSNVYTKKKDFIGSDGAFPKAGLSLFNGKFYGVTSEGGTNGRGVIFEWDPVSNVYTVKKNFSGPEGSYPGDNLTLYNSKFYGAAYGGGSAGVGVIFEWDPMSNIYTVKKDFITATDGANPSSSLTLYDNKFYGETLRGGSRASTNFGTIYELDPSTNDYIVKQEFGGSDGLFPRGGLTLANGKFYGMTNEGGNFDKGLVFEWNPASNTYTIKAHFTGANGANPATALVLYEEPTANQVTGFTLINADTDTPISSLTEGSVVNIYNSSALSVQALTNPGTVGSVRFELTKGGSVIKTQIESVNPYALNGDNNGNYQPYAFTPGSYTLTATPYSSAGATGTAGTPLTINFTVVDQPPLAVTQLVLINADTDTPISNLTEGSVIHLSGSPALSVQAVTGSQPAGSVRLVLRKEGVIVKNQLENITPYALNGDNNGNYLPFTFTAGNYNLTATPYSEAGGAGTVGSTLAVNFSVVSQSPRPFTGEVIPFQVEKPLTGAAKVEQVYPVPMPEGQVRLMLSEALEGEFSYTLSDLQGKILYQGSKIQGDSVKELVLELQQFIQTPGTFLLKIAHKQLAPTVLKLVKE